MKRILVTGGNGFIGKSLVHKLVALKYNVVVLDKEVGYIKKHFKNVEIIQGDVCDRTVWNTLPECDYVFHLAAPSSIILFNADLPSCVETTVTGLMHAFEWAERHHVKKLIYPSSGSIFGKNSRKCTESTIPHPVNSYGKTKLACEYIAKIYKDLVPNLGLRIFAGYGPQEDHKGEIASVVTLFLHDIMQGKGPVIFGDGTQTRDFVYIDDVVDVMIKVMTDQTLGVLNVGSGESVSFNYVVKTINTLLSTNVKPKYIVKPHQYLEKTASNPILFRRLLGRRITSFDQGLKRYLTHIQKI